MSDVTLDPSSQSISAALETLRRGWQPVPMTANGRKRPLIPFVSDRSLLPTSAADVYELWGQMFPGAGVAVLTGATSYGGSGVLVIDVDTKAGIDGFATLADAQAELGDLPETFTTATPSGGGQLWFPYPDDSDTWRNWQGWRPGIDVRGYHGIVGAPGSSDPRGTYTIVRDVPLAELPQAWRDALARGTVELDFAPPPAASTPELARQQGHALAELDALCTRLATPGPGKHGRLVECATIAGSWAHLIGSDALVHSRLLAALEAAHTARGGWIDRDKSARDVAVLVANGKVHPKWAEIAGTPLGNIADYGMAVPAPGPTLCVQRSQDDLGNAERLADHHGEEIAYALDAGSWLAYDGERGVWSLEGGEVLVQRSCQAMLTEHLPWCEAEHYSDLPNTDPITNRPKPSDRDAFLGFIAKSRNGGRIVSAVKQATSIPSLAVRMADFDADPFVLNVANGAVDLRTGALLAHDPALRLSQVSPVAYDPDAKAPLWAAFLEGVQPDPEVRAYLARVVGYALTASTGEQKMWVHHGTGANGKSVFVDTLHRVLGTYAQTIPRSTLVAKTGDAGVPTDLARMIGKRFLTASETAAGRRLDGELVKELTGGEPISARLLHRDFFEFRPVGKIHLTTNHVPQLGADDAIRRRLETVAWGVVVPPEDRDPRLTEKIAAEAEGVLAWAVAGCLQWQASGLETPDAVRERTDEHLALSDPLGEWVRTRLERVPGAEVELKLVYGDYRRWAEESGERPMVARSLSEAMTERGFLSHLDPKSRRRVFDNLRVMPSPLSQASESFGYPRLRSATDSQ